MRIGYCRVSSKSAEQTASIESQAERLKAYGCDRVLVDHGISGFREGGRRGSTFPELIDLILDGTATEVVVPHFDRTQRKVKWGMQLLDALESKRVRLLELDTNTWLDPANNPTDVLMAQIRTAVQENESRVRRLKVRRALAAKRAKGEYASGKAPFGYAVLHGVVVPHPDHWQQALERWQQLAALDFNLAGWIKRYDAQITPRGIKAWIVNSTLRGEVRNYPGMTCQPLVSAQQWEEAQRALSMRQLARGVGLERQVRLFTGLVECDACGKNLHTVTERKVFRLKCMHRTCSRYGQGLQVRIVRERVIQSLVERHQAMAAVVASKERERSPDELALIARIQALEPYSDDPDYALLIAKDKAKLIAISKEPASRNMEQLAELFKDPDTLNMASDEQLRPVIIEFVASILWLGGLESLRVTLR